MSYSQNVISFIFSCIRPFKYLLMLQFMVGTVWAVDLSLRPYLIKVILDRISVANPDTVITLLIWPVTIYMSMSVLIVIIFRIYDYLWLKLNPNLRKYIGLKLMNKMIDHSHLLFQEQFTGSLANKISDVTSGVPNVVRTFVYNFYSHILAIIVATYTLYKTSPRFSFGLIIWISLFVIITSMFSKTATKLSKNNAEVRSRLTGNIVDILSNITNVRFFTGKQKELLFLETSYNKYKEAIQTRDYYFLKLYFFQGGSFVIYQAICLWWLIMGLKNQTMTAGDFALVLTINISIIDCLWNISHDFIDFAEEMGNIEQGINIILAPVAIQDNVAAKKLIVQQGEIKFKDVHFHYKGVTPLFNKLSVTIKRGQKVGLVGYSGSGKSTFVNLILRLFDINDGQILIDNQDIKEVTQESLRSKISMIPQDSSLFHRTLLENIRYGKSDAKDEEVIEAAKKAHVHEFIELLPEGYNSLAGERGVKLSGGQRQRIAIARAILKDAPILILDEATSHLDSLTEAYIQDSLVKLMKNKTSLVVAHRLSTLLYMDRILVFDKGVIIEDGGHVELLTKGGIYKKLWNTQAGGFLGN